MAISPVAAEEAQKKAERERLDKRRKYIEERVDEMLCGGTRDFPLADIASDAEVEWITKTYDRAGWAVERKVMCDRAYLRFTPKDKK